MCASWSVMAQAVCLEAITTVWGPGDCSDVCIHLLRNTFRYASRKYWDRIASDIRPVYTAPTEAAAKERFAEFTSTWGQQYPAIIRLWENAWSEFVPFWTTTSKSEGSSAVRTPSNPSTLVTGARFCARGHFPTEQAAMKCLYLVTRSLDPTGRGKARWAMRWKPALNAFAITFNGRITPTGH